MLASAAMALYAFDGTWNRDHAGTGAAERNTNARRFFDLYEGTRNVYTAGVGTRFGLLGRIAGGLFGLGGHARLDEMYDAACRNYVDGHTHINVVGFSRGAALALDFVNRLARKGIVDPRTGAVVEPAPRVDFLALFDVVAAFGLAVNLGPLRFQEWNPGHRLDLPDNVQQCCHAMALDERRQTFTVSRLDHPRVREVWFAGVHGDVGGGNGNLGLNDIPLRWMAVMAMQAGLPGFTPARVLDATRHWQPDAPVSPPPPYDLFRNRWRAVRPGDHVHYAVALPRPSLNNPAHPVQREAPAEEMAWLETPA